MRVCSPGSTPFEDMTNPVVASGREAATGTMPSIDVLEPVRFRSRPGRAESGQLLRADPLTEHPQTTIATLRNRTRTKRALLEIVWGLGLLFRGQVD